MLKKIIIFSALLVSVSTNSYAQIQEFYIPASIKKSLRAACLTKDEFVISSVKDNAIAQYPNIAESIQNYTASDCRKEEKKEADKDIDTDKIGWKSSIEAGLAIASGNTERESLNGNFKTTYDQGFWKTMFRASAVNQKENDNRIAENYRANLNSRYKLTDDDYVFAETEYVKDRFSGFDYRISENLGYGHVFVKNDATKLEAEASIGARQSRRLTKEKQNTAIQKDTVRFMHKLTKNIIFSENASISFGEDAIISESETSLKTKLVENLYLNFVINLQHISKVPVGTKKTDTLTSLNLGYSF